MRLEKILEIRRGIGLYLLHFTDDDGFAALIEIALQLANDVVSFAGNDEIRVRVPIHFAAVHIQIHHVFGLPAPGIPGGDETTRPLSTEILRMYPGQ